MQRSSPLFRFHRIAILTLAGVLALVLVAWSGRERCSIRSVEGWTVAPCLGRATAQLASLPLSWWLRRSSAAAPRIESGPGVGPRTQAAAHQVVQEPFFRDTLHALVGGPPVFLRVENRAGRSPEGRMLLSPGAGVELASWILQLPDTLALARSTYTHELGHVFDFRRRSPELSARVKARFPESPRLLRRLWQSDTQTFAVAFEAGVSALRRAGAAHSPAACLRWSVAEEEERVPGTQEVVKYLLAHPLFHAHRARGYAGAPLAGAGPGDCISSSSSSMPPKGDSAPDIG